MKKILSIFAVALACSFASLSSAMATPAGTTGPLTVYDPPFGSGHVTTVETYLNTYFGVTDVVYLGRLDGGGFDADAILNGTGATITGTGLTGKTGTWTFNQGTTTYEVVAIEINGGSKGALYAVTPQALSGYWDTNDITAGASGNHPSLSHLDFYARATTPTPEPITLLLFGAGLAGIGAMRRQSARII